MKKAERLLNLLTLLQSRRHAITASAIAERFQISERTVYRDIQALVQTGVPIDGEAGVGYLLRQGAVLPPLTFSENELESLILGVRMVQGWGDDGLGNAADSALEKIRAILPDRLNYLQSISQETLLVPDFLRGQAVRYSQPIREAVNNKKKIQIEYSKEDNTPSTRTIWPLGMIYWGKVWTLVAWCELRDDYRVFRLDRVRKFTQLDIDFETTEELNLKHYLSRYKHIE